MSFKTLTLKKGHEQSVTRRHLSIAPGSILSKSNNIRDGDLVTILDVAGHVLGCGHFQNYGQVSIRILSDQEELPDNFWVSRLSNALTLRSENGLFTATNNCFRLVHSEGDFLPGLIIDIYDNTAVIRCHSYGMFRSLPQIKEALQVVFRDRLTTIFCKSRHLVPGNHAIEEDFFLLGNDQQNIITENNFQFGVKWFRGRNPDFFIDHRENRSLAGFMAKGRRVFNAFCNSGGAFSVYALAGEAKSVVSIDGSTEVLQQTEKNILLNHLNIKNHKSTKSNVNSWLKSVRPQSLDLGIIDPPAYAKSHNARQRALMSYKNLNANAIHAIAPGGYLMTFSRSPTIDNHTFKNLVYSAGIDAGRSIRIVKSLTSGTDFPINLFHSDMDPLKGFLLKLDDK